MTPSLASILFMALLVYLAGMIQVWVWTIGRFVRRSSFDLPVFIPRPGKTPWGIGTMIVVLAAYLGVNLGALELYLVATGRDRHVEIPAKADARPVAKAKELAKSIEDAETRDNPEDTADQPSPMVENSQTSKKAEPLLPVTEGMFLLTLINEFLILAIPCLVRLTSGGTLRDLGLTFENWPAQIKIGAATALFIAPVVYLIQFVATQVWSSNEHPVQDMIRTQFSPSVAYLATLSAVVVAPIVEEIIFRGLVQTWLFKLARRQIARNPSPLDPVGGDPATDQITQVTHLEEIKPRRAAQQAIVMTSFFFAIVHYQQWPAPIPIFLLSLGLGTLYQLTGSLLASISMHATFNSISTLLLLLSMTVDSKDLPPKNPLPQSLNSWSSR